MAITRQQNFLGSQRVDVPHLRAQESAVCYDFDVLAGQIMGGRKPLIVKGFTINVNGTIGADPTTLTMSVAGGLIMHYGASESGSIFAVGDDVAAETLDASNANVLGGFTANTINYIGLDLLRAADDSTADSVQFLDSNTLLEVTQTVDLARTLQYKIVISTQNFSVSSNILPVAKVITNATNGITSITDARPMLFRLGSGGDSVNALSTYSWGTRTENSVSYTGTTDPFTAEDKTINDLKSWIDAIMTSLWEVRGGEYWYSKSVRDNVKLIYTSSVLTYNADNFALQVVPVTNGGGGSLTRAGAVVTVVTDAPHTLVNGQKVYLETSADTAKFPLGFKGAITYIGANSFSYAEAGTAGTTAGTYKFNSCTWKGLKLIFENTPAYWYNTIQDNTETAGIGLLEDQCVYVDLVRSSNATVVPVVASIPSVGTSVIPGRRFILAWRIGDLLYTRDRSFESGRIFSPLATIAVPGLVILSRATVASPPAVISLQGGTITPPNNNVGLTIAAAGGGNNNGITSTGTGSGIGLYGISGATGTGVKGYGGAGARGGVWGVGGAAGGNGVDGTGTLNAHGVFGGGNGTGHGVVGQKQVAGTGRAVVAYSDDSNVKATLDAFEALNKAQVGTFTNSPLNFITNDTEVWSMTAAGILTSIGGPRAIQSVLDPVTAQDAATKNYVDGGFRFNAVHNSDFNVWQRAVTTSATAVPDTGIYCADRWYAWIASGGSTDFDVSRGSATGITPYYFDYCLRIQRLAGSSEAKEISISQEIDRDLVKRLRGKTIYVYIYHREGADYVEATGPKIIVRSGTGAITETLRTGAQAYTTGNSNLISTDTTLNISANFAKSTVMSCVVPTNATCLGISIAELFPGFPATAGVNQYFEIVGVMISTAYNTPWMNAGGSPAADLHECQRYYEKSMNLGTDITAGGGSLLGMVVATAADSGGSATRVVPGVLCTVRKHESAGSFVALVSRPSDGSTGSVDRDGGTTAVTTANLSSTGFTINLNAGITVGDYIQYRWSYSADIGP
jgi:hypothetical protein